MLFFCVLLLGYYHIRNVDKINSTIWRSYFSFFQDEKTASRCLGIKIFQRRKNEKDPDNFGADGGVYFVNVP
jgi:hypothetical protein